MTLIETPGSQFITDHELLKLSRSADNVAALLL